jgi:GNAT superfamily N-acetyltransferase
MLTSLESVTLKSGERVETTCVLGPDPEWAPRLQRMLLHKGDIWNWQNAEVLTQRLPLEARFYVLHRGGAPFANIMTIERGGVGLLGHVWTDAADRGQGAASWLLELVLADFRARGGRALWLGTVFGSHPYRLYEKHGFRGLEEGHGEMVLCAGGDLSAFEAEWFAARGAALAPLGWEHWPTSSPLFAGSFPGVARAPSLGLVGRRICEGPLLPSIRANRERLARGEMPAAAVVAEPESGAVLAFAQWGASPPWPGVAQLELWCHPRAWHRAGELVEALRIPREQRLLAWVDSDCPAKAEALAALGFRAAGTLPQLAWADAAQTRGVDVTLMERLG